MLMEMPIRYILLQLGDNDQHVSLYFIDWFSLVFSPITYPYEILKINPPLSMLTNKATQTNKSRGKWKHIARYTSIICLNNYLYLYNINIRHCAFAQVQFLRHLDLSYLFNWPVESLHLSTDISPHFSFQCNVKLSIRSDSCLAAV